MPDDSQPDGSNVIIRPARDVRGVVRIPGDKSISHRYAMLAAMCGGVRAASQFFGGSGLRGARLIVWANSVASGSVRKTGRSKCWARGRALKAPSQVLDCGNSGSTMRMFERNPLRTAVFERVMRRRIALAATDGRRIMKPLTEMGAQIRRAENGRPPLKIRGGALQGYPL